MLIGDTEMLLISFNLANVELHTKCCVVALVIYEIKEQYILLLPN